METEKIYAKNPAEIILDNPSKPKKSKSPAAKKDPRRVAAGKKAWKTRKQKPNSRTMSKKRMNPKTLAETGLDLYKEYVPAALGTILTLGGATWLFNRYGQNLPESAKRFAPVVIPGVAGVVIATRSKKSNAIMQGVAGGMVFNSATKALQMLMPVDVSGELSGPLAYDNNSFLGSLPAGSVVVTPNGELLDTSGRPVEAPQAALPASRASAPAAPAYPSFEEAEGGFESAERF